MVSKVAPALLSVALLSASGQAQDVKQLHRATLELKHLAKDVFVVTGGISNTGVIVGPKGVVAIDAQMFPDDARQELAAIARITDKPVTTVILTHSDVDHVNGLPGWPRDVQVVAQENVRPEMEAEIAGEGPTVATVVPPSAGLKDYLPTHSIRRSQATEISGVRLLLTHLAAGHTDGDLVIYVAAAKVAFVGDLLTLDDPNLPNGELFPVIHREKQGSVSGWIKVMKQALALDATLYVGGHGPQPVTRAKLAAAIAATEHRYAEIRQLFDAGLSLAQIKARLKDPVRTGPLAAFPTFIDVSYDEMLHQ